ncbi:hypothetical protein ACF07Y_38935 [Streptomyces sp. NPDC016566]|uniref:hypothetical protein n=1 Tax=Streptomyces sp. NPDC016566 TaxID=3364967 RepID=UPI0036F80E96
MKTASNRLTLNADQAADVAHELFEEIRRAAWEKASDDFDDYDLMTRVNDMPPNDALAALNDANLPSHLTRPIAAALVLLAPDTYAPHTDQTPATSPPDTTTSTTSSAVLWQNLADALNALVDAGQFPHFHNLYGTGNNWQHQPYATASDADAPWVVLDPAARQFTVSTRERTLSGEHSRQRQPQRS